MSATLPALNPASLQVGWSITRAAKRIGTSPSALRSWEQRYGLRPSARTVGGHRRYTNGDIATLQHLKSLIDGGMPAAAAAATLQQRGYDPSGDHRPDPATSETLADQFGKAADALDSAEMARAASTLLDAFGALDAWTAVFAPYLVGVGRRWSTTGDGIEREHLAVSVLQTVLDRHTWSHARLVPDPTVLLIATSTEHHTLPLHAAAAALAERDIGTRVLGSLPAASVHATVRLLVPRAVLVWSLGAQTADPALLTELLAAVHIVCAAGPGWTAGSLPAAVTHTNDLADAVDCFTVRAPPADHG